MPPFLKKKTDDTADSTAAAAWHPNFRNFERLPDTKVVRTAFFVNGVAIVVALVMVLWFCYQSYQLHALQRQVQDVQRQIDRTRHGSDQAIGLYKKFQAGAARIAEVDAFVKSKPRVSELLLRLGETLPANLAVDAIDYHDVIVSLRATVRGAPDQASGYASAYLQQLKSDPVFSREFEDIALLNLNRSPQTGRLTLELSLKLKAPKEAKK